MKDPILSAPKVLLALELGENDPAMLQFFKLLAPVLGAEEITVMHVLPGFEPFLPFPEEATPDRLQAAEQKEKEAALRRMKEALAEHLPDWPETKRYLSIEKGDPLKELLEKAKEVKADLVVIGQESGTVHHDVLARNLARYADCNAMVIPQVSKPRIQRLLVPIDFSDNSVRALQAALTLAESRNCRITVFNVYERPDLMAFHLDKTPKQMDAIIEKNHREGMERFLNEHIPEPHRSALEVVLMRRLDDPIAAHIIEYARESAADLILLGAKGHSQVAVLFLGSVTEQLLDRDHDIPVLIVR